MQAQAVKAQSTGMSIADMRGVKDSKERVPMVEIESPTVVVAVEGNANRIARGGDDGTKSSPLELLDGDFRK